MTTFKKSDYGKYRMAYLPKNDGATIGDIEKIDKYSDFRESSDSRFGIQFEVFNTQREVVERIYQLKKYISKEVATELFKESLIKN